MNEEFFDNVIIGAGPAGLNMALELQKRGFGFVLVDKSDCVGGQFDKFPVCGRLISLNKVHCPGEEHSYKLRHDWHTLSSISTEDAESDPKLLFTSWTSDHWPQASLYKSYLQYVAEKKNLSQNILLRTEVKSISQESSSKNFILNLGDRCITTKRLFCGTGTSEPIIPHIEGMRENSVLYENFNPQDIERYRNKVVMIFGCGNSAFEIATFLIDYTAETRIVSKTRTKFARQTHNVSDVRSHVSTSIDLMQLKSSNNIVSDEVVKVESKNGRLLVHYDTKMPHWNPPRRMRRSSYVDEIIVCCGFKYTMAGIFAENLRPETDGKYCLLTPSWESVNVSNLYFIGAPMRVNDKHSASGFIHGYRCNIEALGHMIAEREGVELVPEFECSLIPDEVDSWENAISYVISLVTTTLPLFELFSYFGQVITFENDKIQIWPPLPRAYNQKIYHAATKNSIEIVFQLGFDRYGDGDIPTYNFTLPADHFDPSKSAYVHPVFHIIRENEFCEEFHMQESLVGRWDTDDYIDEDTNRDQYRNVVFNSIACAFEKSDRRSVLPVHESAIDRCYPLLTEEEVEEAFRVQPSLKLLIPNKDAM